MPLAPETTRGGAARSHSCAGACPHICAGACPPSAPGPTRTCRSSDPSASLFSMFHAPHVMRFVCLPMIGTCQCAGTVDWATRRCGPTGPTVSGKASALHGTALHGTALARHWPGTGPALARHGTCFAIGTQRSVAVIWRGQWRWTSPRGTHSVCSMACQVAKSCCTPRHSTGIRYRILSIALPLLATPTAAPQAVSTHSVTICCSTATWHTL